MGWIIQMFGIEYNEKEEGSLQDVLARKQTEQFHLVFEGPVLGPQKDQGPDRTGLI